MRVSRESGAGQRGPRGRAREGGAAGTKSPRKDCSEPLEDYALLGDCETAALVSRRGSIDWLCWPRFDSSACFAALLGGPEHGHWLIAPQREAARITRCYRQNTLILETTVETADGAVTLIDFMPPRDRN